MTAEQALEAAGMLKKEPDTQDESRFDLLDRIFSGRPPAIRFFAHGDQVVGTITDAYTRQKTNYTTNQPEYWEDGSPKLQACLEIRVIEVAAGPPGKPNPPVGELATIYLGSWRMESALKTALQNAGVRGPRPGGTIGIRYVSDEVVNGGSGNPAKVYDVAYDPPGRGPARRPAEAVQAALGDDEPPF